MKTNVPKLSLLSIFIAMLIALPVHQSCGKIDLPETEQEDNGGGKGDNGGKNEGSEEGEGEGGEVNPGETTIEGDTLLPSQVVNVSLDSHVYVKGYIVGYINGTSMSQAELGLPQSKPNSNMLLADSPEPAEDDYLLPVELKATGSMPIRPELNLYDNPEHYKQLIVIGGYVQSYFRTIGLKDVTSYYFPSYDANDGFSSPSVDYNPGVVDGR